MAVSAPLFPRAEECSLTVVCTAIHVLYNDSDNTRRRAADRFLNDWQRTPAAWAAVDSLMGEDPTTSTEGEQRVFFGALTLHYKLRNAFGELSASDVKRVEESVLAHIGRLSEAAARAELESSSSPSAGRPGLLPPVARLGVIKLPVNDSARTDTCVRILTRLCLALASLVVQSGMSATGAVTALAGLFPPTTHVYALALLESLTCIVEEAHNERIPISHAARDAFCAGLNDVAANVIGLLSQLMAAASANGNRVLVKRVFKCASAWVRDTPLDPGVMVASRLMEAAFDAVTGVEALFDSASEFITDLLRRFKYVEKHPDLTQWLLTRVCSLQPVWLRYASAGDDEMLRPLAQIFADAAGFNIESLLFNTEQPAYQPLKQHLLHLVTLVSTYADEDVAATAFVFWRAVQNKFMHIVDRTRQSKISEEFRPYALSVMRACFKLMCMPDDYQTWSSEHQQDFRSSFRFECGEMLSAACEMSGKEFVLQVIGSEVQDAFSSWAASGMPIVTGWERVETCLYCLKQVAQFIPEDDAVLMPAVFSIIPRLPDHTYVRSTSYRLLERVARWIRHRSPPEIQSLYDFVLSSLFTTRNATSGLAYSLPTPLQLDGLRALGAIAQTCIHVVAPSVLQLPLQVDVTTLYLGNAQKLIEVFSAGLCVLAAGQHEDQLLRMITPMLRKLQLLLQNAGEAMTTFCGDGTMLAVLVGEEGYTGSAWGSPVVMDSRLKEEMVREGTTNAGAVAYRPTLMRPEECGASFALYFLQLCSHAFRSLRVDAKAFAPTHGLPWDKEPVMGRPRPKADEATAEQRDATMQHVNAAQVALSDAAVRVTNYVWPYLDATAQAFTHNVSISSRVARLLTECLRSVGDVAFAPLLPRVYAACLALNATTPCAEVMFLARAVARAYGNNDEQHGPLWQLAVALVEPTITVMGRGFVEQEGLLAVADGLMDFVGALSSSFGRELTDHSMVNSLLVHVVLEVLALHYHRDVSERALSFMWGLLFAAENGGRAMVGGPPTRGRGHHPRAFGLDGMHGVQEFEPDVGFMPRDASARSRGMQGRTAANGTEMAMRWRMYMQRFLGSHGMQLCKTLLRALYREWPTEAVRGEHKTFTPLLRALLHYNYVPPEHFLQWAHETMMEPGMTRIKPSDEARNWFLHAAFGVRHEHMTSFHDALVDIIDLCGGHEPRRRTPAPPASAAARAMGAAGTGSNSTIASAGESDEDDGYAA